MTLFQCILWSFTVALASLAWRRWSKSRVGEKNNVSRIQDLRALKYRHETALSLIKLVDEDGAGAWPPKANHDSWPLPLRPYKDIYLELLPLLSAADPSLDDQVNHERRSRYRSLMQRLLAERIDMPRVEDIVAAVEAGNRNIFPRDAYNGFYACVAVCRHAYRWATIPVVKVAQLETIVEFPRELDLPWSFLQRSFGVTADSGNNTANVLHSFDERGERVYKINAGRTNLVESSEEVFFRMFYDIEVLAFPIYHEMVHAIICFENENPVSCVTHLEAITSRLRPLLRIFYDRLTDNTISRSVWLSYVQGFQGWGVGRMAGDKFIKYDGLSGNHVLFFQALDAFLGMDSYLSQENLIRYIPARQRDLCLAFRKHSFRRSLSETTDARIEKEFKQIVNHLKVFRVAHRARVMPYLEEPAPERLTMTAGKSILEGPTAKDTKEALKSLDDMLVTRFKETV